MHHNSTKNKYDLPKKEYIEGWRVDNETDHEVLLDVVLCRGKIVITVKKVFD